MCQDIEDRRKGGCSCGHGPVPDRARLRTGRPLKELARSHDVSASWLFTLWRRYRLEGPAGLEPRSRRPTSSPTRIADLYEDEIVALHKELAGDGLDAGPQSLRYHLAQRHRRAPSPWTIHRVPKARGFVRLEPHKRPKSSFCRFVCPMRPGRRT